LSRRRVIFKSMRLPLRHRLIIAGLFLLLVLVGAWLFTRRSSGELERWKATQRARGEKFTLAEIAPPVSEARREWERSFREAASELDRTPAGIVLKRPAEAGLAGAAWQSTDPFNRKFSIDGWPPFLAAMEANEPALAKVRALLVNVPPGIIYDWDAPVDSKSGINIIARRTAAQILAAGVVAEVHQGHLNPALTNLHALIALANVRDDGGVLVDHMIQSAIGGLGLSATWEAMAARGWDEPRLAGVQRAWQGTDFFTNFHRTAEMERAFVEGFFAFARTNRNGLRQVIGAGGGGAGLSVGQDVRDALLAGVWRSAWADDDELLFLKTMQPLLEGLRAAITNADYGDLRRALAHSREVLALPRGKLAELRRSVVSVASAAMPNWEKACLTLWQNETQRRLAILALALRQYELRHGQLPESLSALAPEFLAAIPVDLLSGKPWRYERADGGFILYSTGENGRDEQAAGDDVVWSRPANLNREM
jgi:hypothetical protein